MRSPNSTNMSPVFAFRDLLSPKSLRQSLLEHSSSSSCPLGYGGTTRQDVFLLLFNRIFREPKHTENNQTTHSDSEETRYRRTCTPFIKMLRRNTPYGNIIYMKTRLKVTRKWPEDLLSYRFILMKQICETGTIFQWKIHERGTYLLSKMVYIG